MTNFQPRFPNTQQRWSYHPSVGYFPLHGSGYLPPQPWNTGGGVPLGHAQPPIIPTPTDHPAMHQTFPRQNPVHTNHDGFDSRSWPWLNADAVPRQSPGLSEHRSSQREQERRAPRQSPGRGAPRRADEYASHQRRGQEYGSDATDSSGDDHYNDFHAAPANHNGNQHDEYYEIPRRTHKRGSGRNVRHSHLPKTVLLNSLLTNKAVNWEIRNALPTASYHSYLENERLGIPFHEPAGLPSTIKFATISFGDEEYQWLAKRWGPIVVENRDGYIKLRDIFVAISKYFHEEMDEMDLSTLVASDENKTRLWRLWQERNCLDVEQRVVIDDEDIVYRRIDLLGGLNFYRMKKKSMGRDQCHLELRFRKGQP